MASLNFDANQHEPVSTDFEPIPNGTYLACVVDSAMKPTKAGNGEYLQLEFEILDGPFKGRHLWDRLTLRHPSQVAVQIAQGKLSALCRAVGVLTPGDSIELHNLPLVVKVKCKKRDDTGELSNEITAYEAREAARPQSATNPTPSTPPWRRG